MIVSASYRTDVPAFHADWFLARLRAGRCAVASPYGGPPSVVDLRPGAVSGFVFWTRNPAPFAAALDAVDALGVPWTMQATVCAYPRAVDRSVPDAETAVAMVRAIRGRGGPRAAVWRYDPIALTSLTPPAWHREAFARLAAALRGAVDEVVVSFLQPYRKTARNMDRAAARGGFSWRLPEAGEREALLADLVPVAAEAGMRLTLCAQPDLAGAAGAGAAACIDAARLSDVAGRPVAARARGNRPGCLCAESRDLGAYDTCAHGCAYCYAVSSRDAGRRGVAGRDPEAESLSPRRA